MMYSEFLTLTGKTENYISFTEYTNEIEPIYTDCGLSKADFINLMNEAFEKSYIQQSKRRYVIFLAILNIA